MSPFWMAFDFVLGGFAAFFVIGVAVLVIEALVQSWRN